MNTKLSLKHFNEKFIYVTDKEQWGFNDVLEVIKPDSNGIYKGDCESYSLTLIDKVEGFESNWDMYFCRINGKGHAVLMKDDFVIDNIVRRVTPFKAYVSIYNPTDMKKFKWYRIAYEKLRGKLITWWLR